MARAGLPHPESLAWPSAEARTVSVAELGDRAAKANAAWTERVAEIQSAFVDARVARQSALQQVADAGSLSIPGALSVGSLRTPSRSRALSLSRPAEQAAGRGCGGTPGNPPAVARRSFLRHSFELVLIPYDMLQGLAGHLISETYLETLLEQSRADAALVSARHELIEWRTRSRDLGPASSLRAMLDAGATPFAAALGFAPGTAAVVRRWRRHLSPFCGSTAPVALVVASWGEPFDPLWRDAVTHAMLRGASCCLLFNGTHVRFVDAGRTFTRRYLEFDIDQMLDDARSFQAFWMVITNRPVARSRRRLGSPCS